MRIRVQSRDSVLSKELELGRSLALPARAFCLRQIVPPRMVQTGAVLGLWLMLALAGQAAGVGSARECFAAANSAEASLPELGPVATSLAAVKTDETKSAETDSAAHNSAPASNSAAENSANGNANSVVDRFRPVPVEQVQGRTITALAFEGVSRDRLEPQASNLALKPGVEVDPLKLRRALRELYATGLYETIRAEARLGPTGLVLVFS